MSIMAVIPARYGSTRFPGKALAKATGKYLIQHVYERVCACRRIEQVIIATDDERISSAASEFSAPCVMTSPDHPSGTDRIAEVAASLSARIIINVQGDEPDVAPDALDALIHRLQADPRLKMATLARPFTADEDPADPNLVKVVLDDQGYALYFSRSLIPHYRDHSAGFTDPGQYLLHLGIYGYRRDFLLAFAAMEPSPLEKLEQLEQLRALQAGVRIAVDVVSYYGQGIDTPEEYAAWVRSRKPQSPADNRKD
ncbi:MAG: 3-deoxy-manno-octulosonate cytidylyltransferase [Actinobacteria bacterium]|nr:3-deoxy-manno-octulosonate cytidylyltransferase [Actinomycetota bacterium]